LDGRTGEFFRHQVLYLSGDLQVLPVYVVVHSRAVPAIVFGSIIDSAHPHGLDLAEGLQLQRTNVPSQLQQRIALPGDRGELHAAIVLDELKLPADFVAVRDRNRGGDIGRPHVIAGLPVYARIDRQYLLLAERGSGEGIPGPLTQKVVLHIGGLA
jgi:hypothetical protein